VGHGQVFQLTKLLRLDGQAAQQPLQLGELEAAQRLFASGGRARGEGNEQVDSV
jgi:hypothetical protein